MTWEAISTLIVPLIKPLLLAGIAWLGKLISDALIGFVKNQKYVYARTIAGVIVQAIEDAHGKMEGSGKLRLAIGNLANKVKLPQQDLEEIVRAAYVSTIIPLDALKNSQAVVSTPSGGSATT